MEGSAWKEKQQDTYILPNLECEQTLKELLETAVKEHCGDRDRPI